MKILVPLFSIGLLMSACSDQNLADVFEGSGSVDSSTLTDLVSLSASSSCPRLLDDRSPTEFEAPQFLTRNADGLVVRGLNPRCITERFARSDLKAWSENGDPVASYVLAVGSDEPFARLCNRFDEVDGLLTRSYEDGKADKRPNLTSRVPEAFIARGILRKSCGRADAEQFYIDSRAAGLDAVEFFGGAW
jgi:hypothetical protein